MSRADATFSLEFRGRRYQEAEAGLLALAKNVGLSPKTAAKALKQELRDFLTDVVKDVARRNSTPYPGGTSANSLSSRSGRAKRSILTSPRVAGNTLANIEGSVGGVYYLRIHEEGGTVRAKKAGFLTIPLSAALRPNGTPIKRKARDWNNTFVIRSRKGNLLIVQKRGHTIIPLYVLKREVHIPARLGMRLALSKRVPEFSDYAPAAMVERMVREHFS